MWSSYRVDYYCLQVQTGEFIDVGRSQLDYIALTAQVCFKMAAEASSQVRNVNATG